MYNDLFSIGPFTVHGYGLMIAIGIILAYVVAEKRAVKAGLDSDLVFGLTITVVIAGIAGAKLLFYITEIREIVNNPRLLLDFSNGFVVYGGIICGILAGYIYCRMRKCSFPAFADLILPSVALAQGFGRIGCFLAGCCYGIRTDGACYVVFTNSGFAPNGVHLVPTQLISSGLDFLNFFVLILLAKKNRTPGRIAFFYLLFYSVGRFLLEFLRGDIQRGNVGILSTSQFISLWVAAVAVAGLVILSKKAGSGAGDL